MAKSKKKKKIVSQTKVIRTEFASAITQIAHERHIEASSIYDAIRQALASAYRKQFGSEEDTYYFVELNEETGESKIFKCPVTKKDEATGFILEWDENKSEDVTPAGFGRIAAQTAKQVILQKIRESERDKVIKDYESKVGEITTAQILRMSGRAVILDLGRGQGYMPPQEQMRGEFYKMNNRITVYIREISDTDRGRKIIVSRSAKELVSKLFEREVPEIAQGTVEIALIAREAGVRTKLAVKATQDGVDPVGSCVGQRGVRVQEVIRELNNEKLDIILYSEDERTLIKGALAPADGLKITLNKEEQSAEVVCPDDQLSLAIGRGGQNVRLAAKLTGYKITIKSSAGDVKSSMTGSEEYEIDTFEGLLEDTRDFLVDNKLTTLADLSRFKHKWLEAELGEEQEGILSEKVKEFDEEMAKRDEFNKLSERVG